MDHKNEEETTVDDDRLLCIPSEPDGSAYERVRASIGDENWDETKLNVTCQVQIRMTSSGWTLQSLDRFGREKQVGGDEFYVTYQAYETEDDHVSPTPSHAVAVIVDCQNGSYGLDFVEPPIPFPPLDSSVLAQQLKDGRHGVLTVYFNYSCGLGSMPPPTKHNFKDGAYTHTWYTVQNVPLPPMREFSSSNLEFPSSSPTLSHPLPNLSSYGHVIAFGDSNMHQLCRRGGKRGKHFQKNLRFDGDKVTMPLNSTTVDAMIQLLQDQHGEVLSQQSDDRMIALLLGSAAWDLLDYTDTLQGDSFADHVEACRNFLTRVRDLYPHVDLYWKSATATHIQVVKIDQLDGSAASGAVTLRGTDRVRYMSESRSRRLYSLQKELLHELNILLLDIYLATYLSAHVMYPGDGRHYRFELNELMLSWFFREEDEDEKDDAGR